MCTDASIFQRCVDRCQSAALLLAALAMLLLLTIVLPVAYGAEVEAADAGHSVEPPIKANPGDELEYGTARSDHISLAMMIVDRCHPRFANPLEWSGQVKAALMLGLDSNLKHIQQLPQSQVVANDPGSQFHYGNAFQQAVIAYSDRLSRDRIYYQHRLGSSQRTAYFFQWLMAALGATATVLVGIKAIWPSSTSPRVKWIGVVIGIGALAASASGTAVSSLNAFYGSQEEVLRDQRTLAQLTQLHWRVVQDALLERKLCGEQADDTLIDKVKAWKERHEAVLIDAMPNFAKPGDVRLGTPSEPVRKESNTDQRQAALSGGAPASERDVAMRTPASPRPPSAPHE
jgi:hypothetical protein